MTRFELLPIQECDLPEVAGYFAHWRLAHDRSCAGGSHSASTPQRVEHLSHLRWLLVENPSRRAATPLGFCARNDEGAIAGAMLAIPSDFVRQGSMLGGLCSASFFVSPEARTQGFFILKKFLNSPGIDFFFATTCGPESAALWSKVRGRPIPGSESTFVVPFRFESLVQSFAENRRFHPALVALLRAGGRLGSAVARTARWRSPAVTILPCRDWEKLAALAARHRNPECITNQRSSRFLEWRLGHNVGDERKQVYTYRDAQGREGWFAVAFGLIGRQKHILASELLDFVWPSDGVDQGEVLSALIALTASKSDALYLRRRAGMRLPRFRPDVIRLNLPIPRCYVAAAKGRASPDPALFDFAAADGDSAP